MCKDFRGERKHTPQKICNFSAEYSYAPSHSTINIHRQITFGHTTRYIFVFPNTKINKKVLRVFNEKYK
jgi:hypothetical protein